MTPNLQYDVNNDGERTAADVNQLAEMVLTQDTLDPAKYDFNQDSVVNSDDAQALAEFNEYYNPGQDQLPQSNTSDDSGMLGLPLLAVAAIAAIILGVIS